MYCCVLIDSVNTTILCFMPASSWNAKAVSTACFNAVIFAFLFIRSALLIMAVTSSISCWINSFTFSLVYNSSCLLSSSVSISSSSKKLRKKSILSSADSVLVVSFKVSSLPFNTLKVSATAILDDASNFLITDVISVLCELGKAYKISFFR